MRIAFTAAAFVFISSFLPSAKAESYLYDLKDRSASVPDAYTVSQVFTGEDFGTGRLSSPDDMFVDSKNRLYIADTGNDRIVVLDSGFKLIKIIDEVTADGQPSKLNQPKGVFASGELIYIADTGNARVIAVDESGTAVRKLTREGLFAVNENIEFQPEKVAADKDGGVFVVDRSIYQGIVQYDSGDRFIGFFAPNEVTVSAGVLILNMWKNLFSDEQADSMEKTLPSPYSNVYIGTDGFVYASASDAPDSRAIKQLNALGKNILKSTGTADTKFGDLETSFEDGVEAFSRFSDVHVDESGIICGADSRRGRLFLYDSYASPLAVFGGIGAYKGSFSKLTAVEKTGDSYIVLDGAKNTLTVFKPTEYFTKVREALSFYNQGLYRDSAVLWKEVLHENSNISVAYCGIGRAYLQDKEYKQAMTMLKEGGDTYFYSLAFKEYRKEFVRKYFVWILVGITAFFILFAKTVKWLRQWMLKGRTKS